MSDVSADPFEAMIRESGESWLIDWYSPRDDAIPHLLEILHDADAAARKRFGAGAPPLTPDSLIAEFARNPHKVRAFLQVIGSVGSPDILVMVWRILQGMNIALIQLEYAESAAFHLYVDLASPESGTLEKYESDNIDDAVILRHLGIIKMGAQATFDGFYALNLGK